MNLFTEHQLKKDWKTKKKPIKIIKNTETSSLTRVKLLLRKIKPIEGIGGTVAKA